MSCESYITWNNVGIQHIDTFLDTIHALVYENDRMFHDTIRTRVVKQIIKTFGQKCLKAERAYNDK